MNNFSAYINSIQSNSNKFSYWGKKKQKGSKGEIFTRNFLKKHNIQFREQYTFEDLYYKSKDSPLRFDFKIWYKDKTFLLEVQGGQHYREVRFSNRLSEEEVHQQFVENQERDKMKVDYCKKHNLVLKTVDWNGNKVVLEDDLMKVFKSIL